MTFSVSLLTPFDSQGRVDLARLRAHVLWLAAQGVEGFVPTFAAGELPYLTDREREAIHRTVIDAAGGRDVVPCTWDPSPATTLWLTRAAKGAGAAGVVVPPPLHYDLDDDAVLTWFRSLAGEGVHLFAWHQPTFARASLSPAVVDQLRTEGVLTGVVDASEDAWRLERQARERPGFTVAAGDRVLARIRDLPLRAFVSDLANVWPAFCLRVFRSADSDLEEALLDRANRVRRAGGLRAMKALLGMGCRAPLVPPPDEALDGLPPAELR